MADKPYFGGEYESDWQNDYQAGIASVGRVGRRSSSHLGAESPARTQLLSAERRALKDWRFCHLCSGMYFDGRDQKVSCPAGGGHEAQGLNFNVAHDVPEGSGTQGDWRFCQHCSTLFFDGCPDRGACAAGGTHQASPRFTFVLPHKVLQGPGTQTDWRFCQKCTGGFPTKGTCPGGDAHEAAGFTFVLPTTSHPVPIDD